MSVAEQYVPIQDATSPGEIPSGMFERVWLHGVTDDGIAITVTIRPVWEDGETRNDLQIIGVRNDEIVGIEEWEEVYVRDMVYGVMRAARSRRERVLQRGCDGRIEFGKLAVNHAWWQIETTNFSATFTDIPEAGPVHETSNVITLFP